MKPFIIATLLCLGSITLAGTQDSFYWNSRLGKGVNLGNALEAPRGQNWGITLEASFFTQIAEAGFTSVRIPIRWSDYAQPTPPYTIEPSFFERVDWVVQQALSNNLVAVINIHHYNELNADPDSHKTRFLALWKQIATHYQNYPATVFFELLNEPSGKLTTECFNGLVRDVVPLIRKTNPTRILIIGGGQWNNVHQLPQLERPVGDRYIIATFHYYDPFQFTHQGAEWIGVESKKWLGTSWNGTEAERRQIIADFDLATGWAKTNNIPLYMGEFGAYHKAPMESRAQWMAFVRAEAERRHMSWTYWEFGAGFGVYDPKQRAWRPDLLRALLPPTK